jgi:bacillithiol biosynthesis cysteine-adding enzyme BshC
VPNRIYESYCAGAGTAFFPDHFADGEARARAVARAVRPLDAVVADAIERQNTRFAPSAVLDGNLARLRAGAAAVVTGQQVGLFLGPLYNVYKAASAIRLARHLEHETGTPVVPVFWLQTEDHDLPEIASCRLPGAAGTPRCLALLSSPTARVSLAHLRLPAEVEGCLRGLRDEIGTLPHAGEHLERLQRHYRPGASWADAFAGVLAELFAPDGLVIVDPRTPELASAAAAVHRVAIERAESIAGALSARSREMAAAGFDAGVHVREGALLSFFHPTGAEGARYRLVPTAGGWQEVGGERTHETGALLDELALHPLSFSTSALLRPIVQDVLLPTAAYVGGAGEIAYFAQLAPLYDEYDLAMPMIVPRAGFRVVEDKTRRLLRRLGVDARGAARSEGELLAATEAAVTVTADAQRLRARLGAAFTDSVERVRGELEAAGPGMSRAVGKALASAEHVVERLVGKYETARLQHRHDLVQAVRQVKMLLYPDGVPQERFYGVSYFAARYGERALLERVFDAIEPFDPTPRDLDVGDDPG